MNKIDFLQTLKDRGTIKTADDAQKAIDTWRSAGRGFDDDQIEQKPVEQKPLEDKKPSAAETIKNIQDQTINGFKNRFIERSNAVLQPTFAGNKVQQATGSATLGELAAIPERTLRLAGGAVANLGDAAFTGADYITLGALSKGIGAIAKPIVQTKPVQAGIKVYTKFEKDQPELANDAMAAGDLIAIPAGNIAGKVAGQAIKTAGKGALNLTSKAVSGATDIAGRTAEYLSDVPKETLAAYGWGNNEIAKNIQKYAGKQHEVGNQILEHLENYEDYMPEKKIVNEALHNMPSINIDNTLKALERSKAPNPGTPSAVSGNEHIDKMIDALVDASDGNGDLSAIDFRNIRMQYDSDVAAAFNKDYKNYVERAGVNARNQMMGDLLQAAEKSGNTQYSGAMKEWARKLQIVDKLKGYIGASPESRARRVDSFVSNVFNQNKDRAIESLRELGQVVDDNLLEKASYTAMAKSLGSTGRPTLFSPIKTGSTMKGLSSAGALGYGITTGNLPVAAGGAAGLVFSSPLIASKILGPLNSFSKKLSSVNSAINKN